ncbi:MAG TPA: sucrase ferredoxin [Candidatus Limnocylindria bacterium]|nr:sucrase ferredoxin [Candidatus Limnocylindria bacterium]
MTLEAPMRCSALAEQLGEAVAGTVEQRVRWLLVEDHSAWGSEAVADVIGPDAAATAKSLALRVQLVRRREGPPEAGAPRRLTLIDTETRTMATRQIVSPAEIDAEAAASAAVEEFGEPVSGPIFLVCTNGKRDACCALRGRALMTELSAVEPESVWETTHLGGHRFAANLVCLPHGIVYGRVSPGDGPRLADAYRAGRLDTALLRGRSAWPAPAQVAEVELRTSLGLGGVDDLRLLAVHADGDEATVKFEVEGATHRLAMRSERGEPRPTSCRGDKLESPIHWRLA